MSMQLNLPIGFNLIPAGAFVHGSLAGQTVESFGMKQTPVTNGEWGETVAGMGRDTYVLLDHNWNTGETKLVNTAATAEAAMEGPVLTNNEIQFDQGDVAILGGQILLKMVANPSAQYDQKDKGRIFSGDKQPVVGVSYFHVLTWCFIETLQKDDGWVRDLPTDKQFYFVASNNGTHKYATSQNSLDGPDYKELVHIYKWEKGRGTTVDVDDPRYEPANDRPFGIDTIGNVWRWIKFNSAFKESDEYLWSPYGLRGGSWLSFWDYGHVAFRFSFNPVSSDFFIGFTPVMVPQDNTPKAGK